MPNILIGYNGKFEPFSYEELLKPIAYATEQQEAYEKAYDDLGDTADAVGASLDPNDPGSQKALAIYNTYNSKLNAARDQLLEKGFKDPNTRQNLMDVKRAYNNGMQKVSSAISARQSDLKRIQDDLVKNPNMVHSSVSPIDAYLDGTAKGIVSANLDDVRKRTIEGAKMASERYFRGPEAQQLFGFIDLYEAQGYDKDEALLAASEYKVPVLDENGNAIMDKDGNIMTRPLFPEISAMMQNIRNSSYYDAFDDYGKYRFDNTLAEGVLSGLGYKEKHNYNKITGIGGGSSGGSGSYTIPTNPYPPEQPALYPGTAVPMSLSQQIEDAPDHIAENYEKYSKPIEISNQNMSNPWSGKVSMWGSDGTLRQQKTFLDIAHNQYKKDGMPEEHWKYVEKQLKNEYAKALKTIGEVASYYNISPTKGGYIPITRGQYDDRIKQLKNSYNKLDTQVYSMPWHKEAINEVIDRQEILYKNDRQERLDRKNKETADSSKQSYANIFEIAGYDNKTGKIRRGERLTVSDYQKAYEKGNVHIYMPPYGIYDIESDGTVYPVMILTIKGKKYAIRAADVNRTVFENYNAAVSAYKRGDTDALRLYMAKMTNSAPYIEGYKNTNTEKLYSE